jgi:hypothetical protein
MGRRPLPALLAAVAMLVLAEPAIAVESTAAPADETAAKAGAKAGVETTTPSPTAPDNSASSLKLLGGASAAQTVTLTETEATKELSGELVLPVRSTVTAPELDVAYLPSGTTAADTSSVTFAAGFVQGVEKNQTKSIPLVFTIPARSSPQDLAGVVVIQPLPGDKTNPVPLELSVAGAGSALKGVSIQPEKVEVKIVGGLGSWFSPARETAGVQLSGPGVPSLFAAAAPPFDLLLRSDNGDSAHATLIDLAQSEDNPTVATATLQIEGDLAPGKYEGTAPISSLSTDAPKLSVALESGNSFVLALLVVFAGAVAGGGLYLASNRRRRKELLRDQMKSLLDNYERTLKQVEADHADAELPMWTLETYLGEDRTSWYVVKWNAIVDFDGAVQTIWSDIHWARNDDDLDEVGKLVDELRARIVRWVTVANGIAELELATKLEPRSIAGQSWDERATPRDTERLLEQIREIEPADDKAAKDLIDRIKRQARWHRILAEAWHARTMLTLDMTSNPGAYDRNDEKMLKKIGLEALDTKACPESDRSAEEQIDLGLELTRCVDSIRDTYAGAQKDLDLPEPKAPGLIALPPTAALMATAPGDGSLDEAMVEESFSEAHRKTVQSTRIGDGLRGTSASTHDGTRNPGAARATVRRDGFWTLAIALISATAYIPTIYNPAWGTCTDYVGAFAAGFLGKAAINWAAMPLFQSLRPSKKAPESTASAAPAGTAAAAPAEKPAAG